MAFEVVTTDATAGSNALLRNYICKARMTNSIGNYIWDNLNKCHAHSGAFTCTFMYV